mmetsp:Transcript_612/g.987  ORF Transcript_612/g.987 Transcript_612/m.987 type:complete len:87 (+) Transcript_612:1501-1761(+)
MRTTLPFSTLASYTLPNNTNRIWYYKGHRKYSISGNAELPGNVHRKNNSNIQEGEYKNFTEVACSAFSSQDNRKRLYDRNAKKSIK